MSFWKRFTRIPCTSTVEEPMNMPPFYKFTYYPLKGLGEPIRFLMRYGGVEFEDDRFVIDDWPKIKPKMPFGQVPVLTVKGKQYHQSTALARFFARKVHLVGNDEWEDLEIDQVVDAINDLKSKMILYFYETDAAIKHSRKGPLYEETLPFYLKRFDNLARENHGYLACKRLTWADVYFVAILDYLNYMMDMDITGKYPNLETVKRNVLSVPAIKDWVDIRPKTNY
ncbi:PREDICTED: glutathione S-transferase-like [Nicrophorus vespilloides]|uniref:glutathione transferase n=1 Tax=Nicrophorus vespilloides TaxID=110193 RepID=A0ABM1M075_NICVS|nr:PREDICTED: glutathione S-transferase-like [Nicrophorus vespilloides]